MMSRRHQKFIEIAVREAKKATMQHCHGAVLLTRSCKQPQCFEGS